MTTLLVDDEPSVLDYLATVLLRDGISVWTARSGREAISAWEAHRGQIDLLVTDVMMPGMDGRELAKFLTADDPAVPVLFISARSDIELGSFKNFGFLPKPFRLAALRAEIRRLMPELAYRAAR